RELQVRDVAKLHRLLQRGGGPADRPAVAGAGPEQAPRPRLADPEAARGRRRASDAGLAEGVFHPVALREEPRAPSLPLQLGADAGRVARQVTPAAHRRAARPPRGAAPAGGGPVTFGV